MHVDLELIRRAQKRATGANIHGLSALIIKYRIAVQQDERGIVSAGDEVKRIETALRLFVGTGQLRA
ncbi:MAG: hypothetical protein HY900_27365 [Deltaproteobacteria bacterium]|nr:hypothetical protein [Deltaproteobacteria bacterium]